MLVGHKRRASLLAALAVATSTVLSLGPAPARASYYESGVSLSTEIVREGVSYLLNIKALQAMDGNRLEISVSHNSNAAGSALRQTQTWSFPLGPGDFTQEWGTYYRIDAGDETGPFHVDLVVERRRDALCSDEQDLFVTEAQIGSVRIETGNDTFETITEVPACAAAWSFSSGPRPGPPRCPVAGPQLTSASLNVKEPRGSDVARLRVYEARERDIPGGQAQWEFELRGTVPATSFRLNRDLAGSLSAAGAPWLSGTARFQPARRPARGEWFDCQGGREARSLATTGAIGGDLIIDVIGYESHTISESEAWAQRSRVRPRR